MTFDGAALVHQVSGMRIPMRDGVELVADVYADGPLGRDGRRYPVVLLRTPYKRDRDKYVRQATRLANHGYAVVLQDVRGRNDSDGVFLPFRDESADGFDTVEWLAAQPWSTGRIGMTGLSYAGWCSWAAAKEGPPHLATIVSAAPGGRWMEEIPYNRGRMVLELALWSYMTAGRGMQELALVDWNRVFWHRPLRDLPDVIGTQLPAWAEWLEHPAMDDYWAAMRLDDDFAHLDIPALHLTGWWDDDQPGALYFHHGMASASRAPGLQRLIIGPWSHDGVTTPDRRHRGIDFGPTAVPDMDAVQVRWFDQWLGGSQTIADDWSAACHVFLTGVNHWVDFAAWPPPEAQTVDYYLTSAGAANTLAGDGRLSQHTSEHAHSDTYAYDPDNPVVSLFDFNFYESAVETPLDRRFMDRRDDILVYTSPAQEEPVTVAGKPSAVLYASSDRLDTDWCVALSDVDPTGRSMSLATGGLRARFRHSLSSEELLTPGEICTFAIPLSHVGHTFARGHRIRLSLTSSEFPVYDRNPNTGEKIGHETMALTATNTVHHGAEYPSRLALPVIPSIPEASRPKIFKAS